MICTPLLLPLRLEATAAYGFIFRIITVTTTWTCRSSPLRRPRSTPSRSRSRTQWRIRTEIVPRYRTALPPYGDAGRVRRNITGEWLKLTPPGAAEPIEIASGCRMQIAAADLAKAPELDCWIEGLELAGKLRRLAS